MGSKLNPGKFDCYAAAEPDEPMFILLARDPSAEYLTAAWVCLRAGDIAGARTMMEDAFVELAKAGKFRLRLDPKLIEADECSMHMRAWREATASREIEGRLGKETK